MARYTWREPIETQTSRMRRHLYADLILWAQARGAAVPWNGDDELRRMIDTFEAERAELLAAWQAEQERRIA